MINVTAALFFSIFVISGLILTRRTQRLSEPRQKFRVSLFLAIACFVSLAPGLTNRDFWPFSAWPLIAGELSTSIDLPRLVALDEAGNEVAIDYRALQPFEFDELMSWMSGTFPSLDAQSKRESFAYILTLVRDGQKRMRSSNSPGYFDRYLGPVTAPYFLLHPKIWKASKYPQQRLIGLRFYRESWKLGEWDSTRKRVLVYEYKESRS